MDEKKVNPAEVFENEAEKIENNTPVNEPHA